MRAASRTLLVALLLIFPLLAQAQAGQSSRGRAHRATAQSKSTAPSKTFDEWVKLGDSARDAGRLQEALENYGKALQIRPKWPEGWWYVGAILYEMDRYAEARDALRNVVALDPERGQAWGMLGLCEYQTREYDRAVISLQRGRKLGFAGNKEIESVVRYHTALLYIRVGQFEIAFSILGEFVRVGNNSPKVIEAFGMTLLRMPMLPPEVPENKRDQVMLAGQAGFFMAARRRDFANSAFQKLLKEYPNAQNVHYSFGVFLLSEDADAAIKEFNQELKISPLHVPSMVQLAFEYLKRDEYNTALPLAEKSVELAPRMFPARNVLGRVFLGLGQIDKAIEQLEEGVRLAPSSPEMHFALARAYTRAGRKQDAARERETFKRLQDQQETERNAALRPAGESDQNSPKQKP
jgi:tetratricopeptide (TPR) repeat protein